MNRNTIITAAALTLTAAGLLFAGPLNPPVGPVTSTYKTLTEVEPRIAINATNTPGDANSLFKITQPGSYYLTGNITGVAGKHGVEITASGVTLDLMGFDLSGIPAMGAFDGVSVAINSLTNITVRNGSVRGWGDEGVDFFAFAAANSAILDIRASGNAGNGILTGSGSTISGCTANDNTGNGIQTSFGCTITGCTVQNNSNGISTGSGCTISGCSANDNNVHGISTTLNCTITGCTVENNNSNGIFASSGCTITGCTANDNTGNGIFASSSCTISECTARSNSTRGIFIGTDCSIIGCTVAANSIAGIDAGAQCSILKTTVSGTSAGPGVTSIFEGLRIEGSSINNNSTFGVTVNTTSDLAELAVINCTIRGNGSAGISSEASTQVLDSVVASNGAGVILTGSGLIRGCTINSNTNSGIELTGNANVVANNTLSSNALTLATSAGVLVTGADNTIDGNRLFSNVQGGIKVNSGGNLVVRNYLARTGATITAVAGNAVAQIISPGAGFISTDPNANFTY